MPCDMHARVLGKKKKTVLCLELLCQIQRMPHHNIFGIANCLQWGKTCLQCPDETPCCRNSEKLSANIKQNDIFFFINNQGVKISLAKILYTNLH